ncbi:hypothetical protein D9M69_626650 [compost metagenome]
MRHKLFIRTLYNVIHAFSSNALNITKVKVGSVRKTQEFFAADREIIFNINRTL